MSDQKDAIKRFIDLQISQLNDSNYNKTQTIEYELALNEYNDNGDIIGLFTSEPEPYSFLNIEKINKKEEVNYSPNPKLLQYEFKLSNQKYTYTRQVYTVMTMIGDLGGFYGAIVIIPAFLMTIYSENMF